MDTPPVLETVADRPGADLRPGVKLRTCGVERVFRTREGTVDALGPFDLEVGAGEFVCVVGPSGCGKTTLLRILAGLIHPTAGYAELAPGSGARVPLAMVFQDYGIYPWKTVAANVRLGLDLAGDRRPDANRRVQDCLARLGLAEFSDAYPSELSGGMRQRVSIARALAVEPEILLMDEPFAALDAQLRLVLQEDLLRVWEADRRTVVFVTHSIDEAILLGDRVVVTSARPGRVLADFAVPFPRPRGPRLRADPRFADLHAEIWRRLQLEVEPTLRRTREPGIDVSPTRSTAQMRSATQPSAATVDVPQPPTIRRAPRAADVAPGEYERRRRRIERGLGAAVPIALLAGWQWAATRRVVDPLFFPPPTAVFDAGLDLVRSGDLQSDLLVTLRRILLGLGLGTSAGVVTGFAMGLSRWLRAALNPMLSGLFVVPKLAILPLLLLTFGVGEAPMVIMIAIAAFFLTWVSTMSAVMAIPEGWRDAARSLGAGSGQVFRQVVFPASLPAIFVGLRLAVAMSILVGVATEFVQGHEGLGNMIWSSWALLQAPRMYVGVVTVALLGVLLNLVVRLLFRAAVPWAASDSGP